jgi:hypothetical protein
MNRKRLLVVALYLFSASGANAAIKESRTFRVSHWRGAALVEEKTNNFSHCAAQLANAGGTSIAFSVDRSYRWSISFTNPAWNFAPGFKIGIALTMNDQTFANQSATFISHQRIQVKIDDGIAMFEALLAGGKLQAKTGGYQFDFNLSDGPDVLFAMTDCVARQASRGTGPRRQSLGARREPIRQPGPAHDPSHLAEAAAIVPEMMVRAQISSYANLKANDLPPGVQGLAAWRSGGVVGTVTIEPAPELVSLDDLSQKIIDDDQVACRGKRFAITSQQRRGDRDYLRILTTCQSTDMDSLKYYLGLPRPRGGYYVFATAQNGFEGIALKTRPAKELLNKISGVLDLVLPSSKAESTNAPE